MESVSYTYDLLCVDCGETLDLGTIVRADETGGATSWRLTGFDDLDAGRRVEGTDLWRWVERFVILHRGHELRVLTTDLLLRLDEGNRRRAVSEYGKAFFEREIHLDYAADTQSLSAEVTERIERWLVELPPLDFELRKARVPLGLLQPLYPDGSWWVCTFRPTEYFGGVVGQSGGRTMLAGEDASLTVDALGQQYEYPRIPGLRLVPIGDGHDVRDFLLRVEGEHAWLRL